MFLAPTAGWFTNNAVAKCANRYMKEKWYQEPYNEGKSNKVMMFLWIYRVKLAGYLNWILSNSSYQHVWNIWQLITCLTFDPAGTSQSVTVWLSSWVQSKSGKQNKQTKRRKSLACRAHGGAQNEPIVHRLWLQPLSWHQLPAVHYTSPSPWSHCLTAVFGMPTACRSITSISI